MANKVKIATITVLIIALCTCIFLFNKNEDKKVLKETSISINKTTFIDEYKSSPSSLELSWKPVKNAEGYTVYRYDEVEEDFKIIIDTDQTTYLDSNLANDTTYKYKVKAYNTSSSSTEVFKESDVKTATTQYAYDNDILSNATNFLSWEPVINADGYFIFKYDSKTLEKKHVATTSETKFENTNKSADKNDEYIIEAYTNAQTITITDANNNSKDLSTSITYLVIVKPEGTIFSLDKEAITKTSTEVRYSGHFDLEYPEYVVINYKSNLALVKITDIIINENTKILTTGVISQLDDEIEGYSACGPTAVAMVLNNEKGTNWNKDKLILFSEENKLNNQGSLRNEGGGMTIENVITLISEYSKKKYSATNLYDAKTLSSDILVKQIDLGKRSIVVVNRYKGEIYPSSLIFTHFIVICGYEYIQNQLYFYYADPLYFGYTENTLRRIDYETLNSSISSVTEETKTILVLE